MNDSIYEFKVADRQTFIKFLDLLRHDLSDNPESWKNNTLPLFLEALRVYSDTLQSYYDNVK